MTDHQRNTHPFARFFVDCQAIVHLAIAGLYFADALSASWGLGPGWNIVISAGYMLVSRSWSYLEAP